MDPTLYLYHKDKKNISKYQYYITLGDRCIFRLEVFQTLSRYEALCREKGSYSLDVYKIITENNILYDGQVIGGTWVLVDTYTYETKDNRIKTVPVLMPLSEYKAALKE